MKIAIVTFGFNGERPGGVHKVTIKILEFLSKGVDHDIKIVSFSNTVYDKHSIALFRPKTFRNKLVSSDELVLGIPLIRIGSIGSELEALRYRKRWELKKFFNQFDLVIVVTGFLQFANVIPKTKHPVIVQCATRLIWERQSQYHSMSLLKRTILYLQRPILAVQEWRVVRANILFLPENSKMKEWITLRSLYKPTMWYPGVIPPAQILKETHFPHENGHFISIGRFSEPRKGWARLFLAYKHAFDSNNSLPDLVVVDWGSFSQEVQLLLDQLTPHYPIRVLANLSNEQRDDQIRSASYFLQTSYEEGLGLAALEALSFGVPLICSDTDGSREYVHQGKSGILVAQGANFNIEFGKAIVQSQTWDYSTLHRGSKHIFNEVFNDEISQRCLIEIIERVFEKSK